VEAGRLDYVERLFHLGANINAPLPSNGYVTDTAPLNVAVENGDAAMVDFLLNHGADPAIASRGEYPLDVVFDSDANISTQIKIIRLLTDHGADINQHGQGQYPLIVNAFYTKKLAAVNAVITLHPNLDLLTPGKQTAVELAAKKQPAPVCRRPRYRRRQLHPHHLHRGRPRRSRRRQQIPRRWRRSQRSRPA
jgi:ankyrin repeat protein